MLDCLVIAPHPDDAELGAAGLILQLKAEGRRVGVLDLTNGEPTPHGSPEIRRHETEQATHVLGLDWRENLGLPNRSLQATLEARHALASVFRRVRPTWLLAPYWVDAHPDHVAATQLIEDARFWAKLTKSDLPHAPHHPSRVFYYYCVHLRWRSSRLLCSISARIGNASCRRSAVITASLLRAAIKRGPSFLDQLRDDAAHWGRLIGSRHGEPFATREPVALSGLRDLL